MARGGKRLGAGRKKGGHEIAPAAELNDLGAKARKYTDRALDALVQVACSSESSDAARVSAAVALLDRGYGKPRQAVEHSGPDGQPMQMQISRIEYEIIDPADTGSKGI